MAFVDTTASISPVCFGAAIVDVVHYRYAKVLTDLLPPGRALTRREDSVLGRLLRGLGMELSRAQRRSRRFFADCDPATSLAALEWWEILLGLPDCEVPTTIEDRRKVAAIKYAAAAGHDQSLDFWTELFAKLGYDFTLFKFSDLEMTCEDDCLDALLDNWQLLLWFIVEHSDQDGLLECRVAAEQLLGMAIQIHYHWDKVDLESAAGNLFGAATSSAGATVVVGSSGLVLTSAWTLASWAVQDPPTGDTLYAVAAVDTILLAAGEPAAIYRSTDHGVTWNEIAFASEEKYGLARGPEDDAVAVAVGDNGSIYRSDNAGLTWFTMVSPVVGTSLKAVTACTGAMVAVGDGGTIIRSVDNGVTWAEVTSPTGLRLWAVAGRGTVLVAVGDDGALAVSQDGGDSWKLGDSSVATDLFAVTANADGRWFASGAGGVIVTNGEDIDDDPWLPQETTATDDLHAATASIPLGFACFAGLNRTIVVE